MDLEERAAWLRLILTPDLGPRTARELLTAFGLPTQVFAAGSEALARVVPQPLARALAASPIPAIEAAITATENWLASSPAHALITLADDAYPQLLLATTDPPPLLFTVGNLTLLQRPALAVVGARHATRQGESNAESFAQSLGRAGLAIVSGLAVGIDAAAHRGALRALDGGAAASTIAVLGTGIDIVYPAANRGLTRDIGSKGLLLSELPLGTPPLAHQFPRRNRLIAGLSRGVLVVEAALRSGSLITARLAAELGREVFALPGSIHAPLSKGCHRLIKDGAKLVESAQDVLEELGLQLVLQAAPESASRSGAYSTSISTPQQALLTALGHDPVDFDTLAARTSQAAGALTAMLLDLELAQHVERLPGNRYQRLR